MKRKIQDRLIMIGITPNLQGFDYIGRAVELMIEDKRYVRNIVSGLYRKIARDYETVPSCVERSIRHAISKVNREEWGKYTNSCTYKNSEFLATLALMIQREVENEQN